MPEIITEALMEMHFFHAQVRHFQRIFGANFIKLLKPSAHNEAWVGFDQGWVRTSLSTQELFDDLKTAIQSKATSVNHFYLGYFLQFKIVRRLIRRSRHFPPHYSAPYLRSELSLEANKTTGLSQHETLLRLSGINHVVVSYACAMLFESDDIYKKPDLDLLRCVDISTSPTGWATNERHFITFRTESDPSPLWCSDPIEGKALGFKEWASLDSKIGPRKLTAEELLNIIEGVNEEIGGRGAKRQRGLFKQSEFSARYLPECFTIMEFEESLGDRRSIRKIRIP